MKAKNNIKIKQKREGVEEGGKRGRKYRGEERKREIIIIKEKRE